MFSKDSDKCPFFGGKKSLKITEVFNPLRRRQRPAILLGSQLLTPASQTDPNLAAYLFCCQLLQNILKVLGYIMESVIFCICKPLFIMASLPVLLYLNYFGATIHKYWL